MAPDAELELLRGICRCPDVEAALLDDAHPCHRVVAAQPPELVPRHTPEPWSGHLTEAPILMVSSNPSLSTLERFPSAAWTDEDLADFFTERFTDGLARPAWIKNGSQTLQAAPGIGGQPAYSGRGAYLSRVRQRAAEILGVPARPGVDYCLTEVVHCKSPKERGVKEAAAHCSDLWLRRILALSPAPVIIIFGKTAQRHFEGLLDMTLGGLLHGPVPLGGRERLLVVMPHPTNWGEPTKNLLDDEQLKILRRALPDASIETTADSQL